MTVDEASYAQYYINFPLFDEGWLNYWTNSEANQHLHSFCVGANPWF
jgi:hypothetical protein